MIGKCGWEEGGCDVIERDVGGDLLSENLSARVGRSRHLLRFLHARGLMSHDFEGCEGGRYVRCLDVTHVIAGLLLEQSQFLRGI